MSASTFDEVPIQRQPVHLLLIARSKFGKSTYAAEAALQGFRVLYIDSDNGASALSYRLRDHPEAKQRIHYIRTEHPVELLYPTLFDSPVFRWNKDLDKPYKGDSMSGHKPEHRIVQIVPSKIPPEVILVVDSWTSVAMDALGLGADKASVTLDDMGNAQQGVYGAANMKLNLIEANIQHAPFHVIVLAHSTFYERYEKPTGQQAKYVKQGDMVLQETIEIPVSSSRPHGAEMGKYFNHIGHLDLDNLGSTFIDFTRKPNRVGGGPPNRKDSTSKLNFKELAHGVSDPGADGWITEFTVQEYLDAKEAAKKPALGSQAATLPSAGNKLAALKLK